MRKGLLFLFMGVVLGWMDAARGGGAVIRESTETIKTYPFSDPDPVAFLARETRRGSGSRLYPYFFFDGFSKTAVEKEWRVVRMENPHISVSVLPEVGGKVWGAAEKSTGREFIYTNHVLKFREIALRGPWASGGIEFNFGMIGHAPSCATPVDYVIRENTDGSVSCVVGTLDLPSRTRWSVAVTLPPDKAYFETQAFWYNPTTMNQSYYVWMNNAVKAGDGLQYVFPGRRYIGHDYASAAKPWPVDAKGRDLSWYKNNNFGPSKSYFAFGEYEDFNGGYWHNSKFGFGHWALHDDAPGQKVWLWALSRQGGIWEDLLTDEDGQYSEPQTGRLLNQSDHEFFAPGTADLWREIWFPYKEIGPMVKANPDGVLNVTRTGGSITVGVCALRSIGEDLAVRVGDEEVYRERLALKPMEVYRKTLPGAAASKEGVIRVQVGRTLQYSSDPGANDLERPLRFHEREGESAESLFLQARRSEASRRYGAALKGYLACLEKEPIHIRALCRLAELYYRRAEYERALSRVHTALDIAMYDPEANYLYGVISRRLGRPVDAKETLGWAARSMQYRSAAYGQIAEIHLLDGNEDLALEYTGRSLDFNRYNMNALQLRAAVYRKRNEPEKAREVLDGILEIEPLNHFARFESYLLEPNRQRLQAFRSMIRGELPHESYLETALYYAGVGLEDDAVRVLETAPEHPTVYYWLAYLLRERNSGKSESYLERAREVSPRLAFPFRQESIPVFRWAVKKAPDDWKAKYYLGLIYWAVGREEETRDLFAGCGLTDYAPFHLARGSLFRKADPAKARADFQYAVHIDPDSWRARHRLIRFHLETGEFDRALALARESASKLPDRDILRVDLVRALMGKALYGEALEVLAGTSVLPFEGARDVRDLFVKCHVNLALKSMEEKDDEKAMEHLESSREFPERLGTGKPYNPDYRVQDYLAAVCFEKLGQTDRAEQIRSHLKTPTREILDAIKALEK